MQQFIVPMEKSTRVERGPARQRHGGRQPAHLKQISFLFVDYLSVRRPWETRSSSSDGMGWTARCSGVSGLTLAIYGPADRASHTNEAHRSPGDSRDGLGSPWEPRLFLVSETKKLKLAACRRR